MATRMTLKQTLDLLAQTRRACDDKDVTIALLREDNSRKENLLRISQVHVKQARAAVATDKPVSDFKLRAAAARELAMRTGATVKL